MAHRASPLLAVALLAVAGCHQPIDTLPPPVTPMAAVRYHDLELPAGLEIRSIDFSASTFADASGPPAGPVSSTIGGRAFVKVHAVDRRTGDAVLLLYEDIGHRTRPTDIIRFHASGEAARPDTTR